MKLTVLQENLKNAVSLASRFVSPKAQLPILGNILLKTDKLKLTLSATNFETSVKTSIGAKIIEEGEITVNGKTLNDVVSNLSSGSLEIEVKKEQVKITSGSFRSNILGINSSDFPVLPGMLDKNSFNLKKDELVDSLSKVLFSVSTDETRPILTGVLFVFMDKSLYLVSTDGFRLSEVKLKSEINVPNFNIIIPKTVLFELSKIEGEESVGVSFNTESNQVIFSMGETLLLSRVIEGDFPDYQKIIPSSSVVTVYVDKMELEKSIKLASVFARDSGNIVKLKVLGEKMTVTAESSSSGSQEMELGVRTEGNTDHEIEIMFNYRFIEEFLKVVEDDEVKIMISDNSKASKFLDPKSKNYLHIIMPIKKQD